MPKHVMFHHKKMARAAAPKGKAGLDYPASTVGQTPNTVVMLADALASQGSALAQAVLAGAEQDYQTLAALFGGLSVSPLTIVISPLSSANDGTGGAYHGTCQDTVLYVDADLADGEPTGSQTTLALFVAEAVECFSAKQAKGWDCGSSNGEGLSRVLAEQLHPGILDGYETASVWLDGGRPDFVTQTDPTDQNAVSTGCAVLFLWWLRSQLGYSWQQIIAAGAPTLAGTYQALTGKDSALADFMAACAAKWPANQSSGVQTDNPWSAAPPPPPPPAPPPVPPPPAPSPSPSPSPSPAPGQSGEQFVQMLIDEAFQMLEANTTDPLELAIEQEANTFIDNVLLPGALGNLQGVLGGWMQHMSKDPIRSALAQRVGGRMQAAMQAHPLLQLLAAGAPVQHVQQLHAAKLSGGLLQQLLQDVIQYGPGILQLVLQVIGAVKGGGTAPGGA